MFNLQGKVVGINNRLIGPNGANIGVGFAIPAEEAAPVVEALKKGQKLERGYLGIAIRPVDETTADALGITKNRGEQVQSVVPGEAAAKAGLNEGDIVLKIAGQEVTPEKTLSYIVANIKPGTKIPIDIIRENKPSTLNAVVGARPSDDVIAKSSFNPDEEKEFQGDNDSPEVKVVREAFGFSVIPMDAQIARTIGVPETTKGLVIDVPGVGSAGQMGIKRADIIVSGNYKPVVSAAQLVAIIKEAKAANRGAVLLGIKRRGGPTQYAAIKIDK